jgi:hypothetical protein
METNSVIFLATAAGDSSLHREYVIGCLEASHAFHGCNSRGDITPLFPAIKQGLYVEKNRDFLTRKFVESRATDLLFVDTDIGWRAAHLSMLLEAKKDVISGTYSRKTDAGILASYRSNDGEADDGELERCESLPAGFLLITKGAVLRVMATMPNDVYEVDGTIVTALWHPRFNPGAPSYRDDAAFSKHCRDAGIELWRHKGVVLTHYGEKGYRP